MSIEGQGRVMWAWAKESRQLLEDEKGKKETLLKSPEEHSLKTHSRTFIVLQNSKFVLSH
jgi:hypothetical protein